MIFECAWCGEATRVEHTSEISGTGEIVCFWCCDWCRHCGAIVWLDDVQTDGCGCTVCKSCVGTSRSLPDSDDIRDMGREERRSCDPDDGSMSDEPTWSAEVGIWTE